jgi:hypothetical protein
MYSHHSPGQLPCAPAGPLRVVEVLGSDEGLGGDEGRRRHCKRGGGLRRQRRQEYCRYTSHMMYNDTRKHQ